MFTGMVTVFESIRGTTCDISKQLLLRVCSLSLNQDKVQFAFVEKKVLPLILILVEPKFQRFLMCAEQCYWYCLLSLNQDKVRQINVGKLPFLVWYICIKIEPDGR